MNLPALFLAFFARYTFMGYVFSLAVAALFLVLSEALAKLFCRLVSFISKKTANHWDDQLASAFSAPLRLLIVAIGLLTALRIFPGYAQNATLWLYTVRTFRCCMVALIAWGLFNLEDASRLLAAIVAKRLDLQENNILFPFLSKMLRFITVAIAFLIIAQEWNFSISGLLAGLGLGGLAFALAAKDMLSNIFGGVIVFLDKPFRVGDWITAGSMEGTVEDITFRSVKLRTAAQALVTLPNSELVSGPIINWSRMGKRKVSFTLGLPFHTGPQTIVDCVEKIRSMLTAHEGVHSDGLQVALDDIGDSSLRLLVFFYTVSVDYTEHLAVKQDVFLQVLTILQQEDVHLALPASTIRIDAPGAPRQPDGPDET